MGPAVALIVMTYAGCDALTAMVMLIVALTFNGAACQTSLQNHQDLAPNFAGSLYGIMNTFGSFPGFIIPSVIGALTSERVRLNFNLPFCLITFLASLMQSVFFIVFIERNRRMAYYVLALVGDIYLGDSIVLALRFSRDSTVE